LVSCFPALFTAYDYKLPEYYRVFADVLNSVRPRTHMFMYAVLYLENPCRELRKYVWKHSTLQGDRVIGNWGQVKDFSRNFDAESLSLRGSTPAVVYNLIGCQSLRSTNILAFVFVSNDPTYK